MLKGVPTSYSSGEKRIKINVPGSFLLNVSKIVAHTCPKFGEKAQANISVNINFPSTHLISKN